MSSDVKEINQKHYALKQPSVSPSNDCEPVLTRQYGESEDDKLVFLHIPKTGGTSINNIFASHFSPSDIFPDRSGNAGLYPSYMLGKYRFFSPHARFSFLSMLRGNIFSFTLLRDPLERSISE